MSNPYDPYNPGQNEPGRGEQPSPYGAPIPSGGGGGYGDPYGQNPYGGGYEPPKKTDAVSITGFVLSLTCCLSIVGAILGFIGLGRTKNGQRKGRWAAISAAVVGVLGTLAFGGIIVAFVFVVQNQITIDNAEVGQCMNVDEDGDNVSLSKKDCGDDHDAQIVYLGSYDDILNSGAAPSDPDDFTDAGASALICRTLLDGSEILGAIDETLGEDAEFGIANEDDNPSGSDEFICYVGNSDESKLDQKIG